MENILAQAKKIAEEAEVFMVSSEETNVQFEANRLKHVQSRQGSSVALRITRQGRIGYATSTDLADSQNLVNMAEETAQFGMKAEFEFPPLSSYPQIEIYDSEVGSVSIDEMIRIGEGLISTVKSHTPEIICEGGVSRAVTSVRIINSRGGQAGKLAWKMQALRLRGSVSSNRDGDFGCEPFCACRPFAFGSSGQIRTEVSSM